MVDGKIFESERIANVLIVSPQRSISSLSDESVESESQEVIETLLLSGIRHVIVDFSKISFFGSTMLDQMVTIWRRLKEIDGVLALAGLSHVGREIVDAAGFQNLFGIYATREDALDAFRENSREPSA